MAPNCRHTWMTLPYVHIRPGSGQPLVPDPSWTFYPWCGPASVALVSENKVLSEKPSPGPPPQAIMLFRPGPPLCSLLLPSSQGLAPPQQHVSLGPPSQSSCFLAAAALPPLPGVAAGPALVPRPWLLSHRSSGFAPTPSPAAPPSIHCRLLGAPELRGPS